MRLTLRTPIVFVDHFAEDVTVPPLAAILTYAT